MALRHCPKFPLPETAYLPGSGSPTELRVDGATLPLRQKDYRNHRGLAVGIDLFNHGFFWEAHEVWEQTWKASVSNERELLQGLIQLAAAKLNRSLGKETGADRVGERAQRHLAAAHSGSALFCGIDLDDITAQVAAGKIRWLRRTRDLPGSRSDLLVQPFDCTFSTCPYGVVLATTTRTDYYSGNSIYADQPVQMEDAKSIETWRQRCQQQITTVAKRHTVQWELEGEQDPTADLNGATFEHLHVLRANQLRRPTMPTGVEFRKLTTDAAWEAATQLAFELNFPDFGESARPFSKWRYQQYRQTTEACGGSFYAAFVDGQIASCLGTVVFDGGFRFQDVQTGESFRRRGIARALVAHAFRDMVAAGHGPGIIAAEPDEYAKTIYLDLGFVTLSTIFKVMYDPQAT